MSTASGGSQKPGKVLMNPLSGLGVVWKGLFNPLELPVVGKNSTMCAHQSQFVMEHLVVKDIFNHVSRNRRAVQHRVNSYEPLVGTIGSQAHGSGSTASFTYSPCDGTPKPAPKIEFIEAMEMGFQVHMRSLRMKTRGSWSWRGWTNTDFLFMVPDEVPQQGSSQQGRPPNEVGKHPQDLFRGIEKHLMKPHRAGPVFPLHGDHGPRIIRDPQRQGDIQKFLKP